MSSHFIRSNITSLLLVLAIPQLVAAQLEFEGAPIHYSNTQPVNQIEQLQARIDSGEVTLEFDRKHGYLKSLLRELEIPVASQALVFSKTSLQLRRISRRQPRAIYFNDDTYIGWVQNGDVIEISTADPQLGGVFYTLLQEPGPPQADGQLESRPRFVRDQGQCLTCHASSRTENIPGHLMRSVYSDRTGQPHFGSGTYNTTQASPFEQRWGGWYVTGQHGALRHMGNVVAQERQRPEDLDRETGANVLDLSSIFDVSPYLTDSSDLVALLVLGHQVQMHNLLAKGSIEARLAAHYDGVMNAALNRPEDHVSESTERKVANIGEKILKCLFFQDEVPLTAPIQGNTTFTAEFMQHGPVDDQERSLREFDLQTRLFRYPCSFLIYSDAFRSLPSPLMIYLQRRIAEILASTPEEDEFQKLSCEDRKAIREILESTLPEIFPSQR